MVVEVQTLSDTTFRVFDWNRLERMGNRGSCTWKRPWRALTSNRPQTTRMPPWRPSCATRLTTCKFFTLDRMTFRQGSELGITGGEPAVWVVLEGQGVITCEGNTPTAFVRGDTLLLPAAMKAKMKAVTDGALPCWRRGSRINAATAKESMKVRLQRFVADCGVASRRECEQMIVDGRVRVNGEFGATCR